MENWPITQLPLINFNHSKEDNVIRSKPEDGPVLTRSRFSKAREQFDSFTWQLKQSDKEIVETFYNDTLASGSLPFDFIHPRIRNGAAISVRFSKPPVYTYYGGRGFWSVQCSFDEV